MVAVQLGSEPKSAELRANPLLILAALVSISFAIIPICFLLDRALASSASNLQVLVFRAKTLEIALTTVGLTLLVSMIAAVLGVSIAWALHNVSIPNVNLMKALAIVPIAIPSYVFTYCWLSLEMLGRGFLPAMIVLALGTTPYVIIASLAGLRRVDSAQGEVARTLGLNGFQSFRKITWPQIQNSVAAGVLLSALCVLSDFGTVSLMGVDTFTRAIQNTYQSTFDRSAAAMLALLLVLISAILISIEHRSRLRFNLTKSSAAIVKKPELMENLKYRVIGTILVYGYVVAALIIPLTVLMVRFLQSAGTLDQSKLWLASLSTILVSSFGAALALLLAVPIALLALRGSRLGRISDRGVLIVHALPGIVMGLALVSFGSEFPLIYQTALLLALAYALLFMAKSVGSIRASLDRVPRNLLEISATLGQSKTATFRKVLVPLAAPGVLSGVLLVLLAAMKELPATLMLRPTGFETLATEMWSYTSISRYSEAAPYALALVLIAAVPAFLINRPDRRDNESGDLL